MIKFWRGYFLSIMMFFLACDESYQIESPSELRATRAAADSKSDFVKDATREATEALSMKLNNDIVSGAIDKYGVVTINYPAELRGDIGLIGFKGGEPSSNLPFTKEHCKHVAAMVKHGFGAMIRHSRDRYILNISLPAYVSSALPKLIIKHANSQGYVNPRIKNRVEPALAHIKLHLSDDSISRLNGRTRDLELALNLGARGEETDTFNKKLTLHAGDIVCDLATKRARIQMDYPVDGEMKSIKVIFEALDFFVETDAS